MPTFFPNPSKQFQFRIAIDSPVGIQRLLNPFQVQEVDEADHENDIDEHGENSHIIKTAGMIKYSNVMISKIQPSTSLDNFVWAWRQYIMSTIDGGGAIPSLYKTQMTIDQLAADNITVISSMLYLGIWPQKINGRNWRRAESGNTIERIEFCVDEAIPLTVTTP